MTDELDKAIDEVCNRFEAAWDAFLAGEGKRPALEEHLQQVAAGKEKSFALLLKVEIEKRLGAGEEPNSKEYSKQFPVMKEVVEELLPSDAGLSPTRDGTRKKRAANKLPGQIGPYKILQTIGEGGMGSVYLAQQTEPIRRQVALKVIKAGMDTKQVVARFEAERQALAMMDHQNIAKVLDAGVTEQGQPFFAMELVKGIPITKYCDKNKLPLNDRLDLFVQVCRAIQHAHQKGVIHRDLKPSNVLVTLYDGVPIAKVIDFGLAKALQSQQRLTDKTLFTEFGRVIGTLEYMSPEQAEMNELGVDTRTDVYSLGVMLYELLTGTTPLGRERIRSEALHRVLDLIRDEEPSRPSTRLSQSGDKITGISQLRQIDSRRLSLILKGELDWIAIKALEKDRTRRYDGAGALADDVQRYLNQEAILARPPSVGYRLNKTIRKHKAAFASGAAILVLLIAGLIGTGTMWSRASVANREAREAEEQAKENLDISLRREGQSQVVVDFLVNAFRNPDTTLDGREAKVADMLQNALSDLQGQTELTPLNRAPLLQALGQTFDGLGMFEQALAATKQAYELRKENLGENHDDTLHTKVRLGIAYLQAGDSGTAFELLDESLAQRRAKYGNEDPSTLDLINTLAVAYRVAGDPNKALPLFKEALERRRAVLGAEHLLTLDSLRILAHFYFEISEPAKTIPLLKEILAIKRKKFGENNLDTLAVLNELAGSYARTGDLAKTKETLRESIQLRREHFPDHWETYDTIAYFGAVMTMFELHEEAEPLLLEGIKGLQARLKTDPVFKLSVIEPPMQSLIDSYNKLNKSEEAAKWQAALEKMRAELGSQSPQPKSNSATAPEKQPST